MKYFLIGGDGKKYGPATVETLKQWVKEGRLNLHSKIIDEQGERHKAGEVPGLFPKVESPLHKKKGF